MDSNIGAVLQHKGSTNDKDNTDHRSEAAVLPCASQMTKAARLKPDLVLSSNSTSGPFTAAGMRASALGGFRCGFWGRLRSTPQPGYLWVGRDRVLRWTCVAEAGSPARLHPSLRFSWALQSTQTRTKMAQERTEPMGSGVAPGCPGNSQWAAGIVLGGAARNVSVKWGRYW